MKKIITLLATATTIFLLSCSETSPPPDDGPQVSEILHQYCIFAADKVCMPGPVYTCPSGSELSDECPNDYEDWSNLQPPGNNGEIIPRPSNETQAYGLFIGDKFIDPRDIQEYSYTLQGGKVWMIENLRYSRNNQIGDCNAADCEYTYNTAMDENSPQGICPKGWRIPSIAEWQSFPQNGKYWPTHTKSNNIVMLCTNASCTELETSDDSKAAVRCVTNEMKCDTTTYNPATKFCLRNKLEDRCGGQMYEPKEEFCFEDVVYSKCGGDKYNPKDSSCVLEFKFPKCGNAVYNDSTHFCEASKVYIKCDGEEYDPENKGCFENKLFPKCGGKIYNEEAEFCEGTTILPLCDGEEYDSATEFCSSKGIKDLCGGYKWNPVMEFCLGGSIVDLCGGETYNPVNQFCKYNNVWDKCGGDTWDPATQECDDGVIVPNVSL